VPVFREQSPNRRALVEDWQQAALRPVLHHVIGLADEERGAGFLGYNETGDAFHIGGFSSTGSRTNKHLRRLVIACR
jgi:hypothetical protein